MAGGWPRETRDVWTERSDRELISTFEGELAEAFWISFGWKPPASALASAFPSTSQSQSQSQSQSRSTTQYRLCAHGQGELGEKIPAGLTADDRAALARLAHALSARSGSHIVSAAAAAADADANNNAETGAHDVSTEEGEEEGSGGSSKNSTRRGGRRTLSYGVRAPSTLFKLGGPAAFEKEARLALFLDRARGGRGAW